MEGQQSSCFSCISCHTIRWQMAAHEKRVCVLFCIAFPEQKYLRVVHCSLVTKKKSITYCHLACSCFFLLDAYSSKCQNQYNKQKIIYIFLSCLQEKKGVCFCIIVRHCFGVQCLQKKPSPGFCDVHGSRRSSDVSLHCSFYQYNCLPAMNHISDHFEMQQQTCPQQAV